MAVLLSGEEIQENTMEKATGTTNRKALECNGNNQSEVDITCIVTGAENEPNGTKRWK